MPILTRYASPTFRKNQPQPMLLKFAFAVIKCEDSHTVIKCEDSHTAPEASVPVKAVRTAQTLQSWEVKTGTSESADLCQHLCQLWFWDTQQSLPWLPLTAMPVLPFRGYEDSLEVDIVEVPARGHLRLIALKLFDEQLINQTLEIWFHEFIILFFVFLVGFPTLGTDIVT